MQFKKHPARSALVDLVMKDATEEERIEATGHWFGFLEALLRIAEEDMRREQRGEPSRIMPPAEDPDHHRSQE